MPQTINITNKWQIHIPVAIRKKLGLTHPSQATIKTTNKGEILIKPKKSGVLSLAGKYKGIKPVKPVDIENVRDYIDYSDL